MTIIAFHQMVYGQNRFCHFRSLPFLFEAARKQVDGPAREEVKHKDGQIDAKGRVGAGHAVGLDDLLGDFQHLHHADHQHKAGGLDHAGDEVDGQRDQPPHRLRDDDVPISLRPAHAQRFAALVLVLRDGDQRSTHKVAHLRRAPQHKDDDGGRLAGQVPPKGAGRAEVDKEEQHHLRHDPDDLQIDPEDGFQDGIFEGHQHAQQDAQRQTDKNGDGADPERHAEAAQQAKHVFALQQDFKTQIRHSAPSFPANCPAATPAAG